MIEISKTKIIFLILVFLAAVFEAGWDIILKKWALDSKSYFFIIGITIYFIATVIWAFSLKYEFLSKAISMVTIINSILVIMVGVLYFKEQLSTVNKFWILLWIISIVLLEL